MHSQSIATWALCQVHGPRRRKVVPERWTRKTWSLFSHKIPNLSIVNQRLNGRSPLHKESWASRADFISDLFFIISWSYWCFRGSGGSEKALGECQPLNFGTQPFRGSHSCSQKQCHGVTLANGALCARAGACVLYMFVPAASHPSTPPPSFSLYINML